MAKLLREPHLCQPMPENTCRLSTALADRYQIERRLRQGGMATVYLKNKRKVAVKVLRPELAAVLGAERFVQEITTTANLQHPHILPLFDSGEADSFFTLCDAVHRWRDDQRFITVRPGVATSTLMMVVNWTEELKALGR
jgi:serine/threonine protein kinase